MSIATKLAEARRSLGLDDHIVVLDGATWADYERLLEIRGDRSGPRISYLEGSVEIMSPSPYHEGLKSAIGCLLDAWCLENGVEFTKLGSWTLKRKAKKRGAEPDECYLFGVDRQNSTRPDLAIEVIWTHGGLDKLDIYRKLGVREVWIWEDDLLTPHVLRDDRYVPSKKSEVLSALDLAQLASFLDRPTTSQAIRDYRGALRARG